MDHQALAGDEHSIAREPWPGRRGGDPQKEGAAGGKGGGIRPKGARGGEMG